MAGTFAWAAGLCCVGALYEQALVGAAEPVEAFRAAGMDESRRRFREVHGEFLLVAASCDDDLRRDFLPRRSSA